MKLCGRRLLVVRPSSSVILRMFWWGLMHSRSSWKASDEADCSNWIAFVSDSKSAILSLMKTFCPHWPSARVAFVPDFWGFQRTPLQMCPVLLPSVWRSLDAKQWSHLFSPPSSPWTVFLQFLGLQLGSSPWSRWSGRVQIKDVLSIQFLGKDDSSVHFKGCLPRRWPVIWV